MTNSGKYALRFFFEWGSGCLWAGNDEATTDFGYGPLDTADTKLPLSAATVRRCEELSALHDTSLNQAYPPDPSLWRQRECDRFNEAVRQLVATIRTELGAGSRSPTSSPMPPKTRTWTPTLPTRQGSVVLQHNPPSPPLLAGGI